MIELRDLSCRDSQLDLQNICTIHKNDRVEVQNKSQNSNTRWRWGYMVQGGENT